MSARMRAWLALAVLAGGCVTSAPTPPPPPASPVLAPPSEGARALLGRSLTRRPVATLPSFTKMALVKLLPREAPALADDVDAVLDEDAYTDDVLRRLDAALAPDEQRGLTEALAVPEVAFVLSVLIGEAPPAHRTLGDEAPRELRERLFEAAMPPGRATAIAQLPLAIAARAARAALLPEDARQADLARFLSTLPTLPRLEERDAFVRALAPATRAEIEAASTCFLGADGAPGPCARAHDALHAAHLAAAEERAATLERRLREAAR